MSPAIKESPDKCMARVIKRRSYNENSYRTLGEKSAPLSFYTVVYQRHRVFAGARDPFSETFSR